MNTSVLSTSMSMYQPLVPSPSSDCNACVVMFVQKLLDAWYPLWMLVFQPAIGVLMLGAVCCACALLHVSCWSQCLHTMHDVLDWAAAWLQQLWYHIYNVSIACNCPKWQCSANWLKLNCKAMWKPAVMRLRFYASELTFITDTYPGMQLVSGAAGWLKNKSSAWDMHLLISDCSLHGCGSHILLSTAMTTMNQWSDVMEAKTRRCCTRWWSCTRSWDCMTRQSDSIIQGMTQPKLKPYAVSDSLLHCSNKTSLYTLT